MEKKEGREMCCEENIQAHIPSHVKRCQPVQAMCFMVMLDRTCYNNFSYQENEIETR